MTKTDAEYEQGEGHPDLSNMIPPCTSQAHEMMQARRKSRSKRAAQTSRNDQASDHYLTGVQLKRRARLSSYQVSEIVISRSLKDRAELLTYANGQKREGKTDLAEFVVNRGAKAVNELIHTAWEIHKAEETVRRREKSRLELLREAASQQCVCETLGLWEICALELLHSNDIPPQQFRETVKQLLEKGRGKHRNIMLTGPADCGKTFLLNPLNKIYHTFTNPASSNFAWVGAEKAEVIFLNDFRWSAQIITWHDLLLLLEGQVVHLPAPKSHFAADVKFDRDTPIFCTTKQPLSLVRNGCVDERETEMMQVRWVCFAFHFQVPRNEQKDIAPCPSCFANMILCEDDSQF